MVSIITVNYNQAEATCALLDSIRRQGYRDVEVIVVDNGSGVNPVKKFSDTYPEIKFLRSEQNLGFAGGNNLGLKISQGDFIFFVNNDVELSDGCIEWLLLLFKNRPKAGIASPLICYFPEKNSQLRTPISDLIQYAGMTPVNPFTGRNKIIGNREPDRNQFTEPRRTAYAHGAAMMVPREVLEQVGPMAEEFFLYYEELDWCERIRRAGWEIWVEPRARVWHKESLTVQRLGALKTYYLTRNRILFMRRNFGGRRLAAFFAFLFFITVPKNLLVFLFRGEWENAKAFWRGIFWNFDANPSTQNVSF